MAATFKFDNEKSPKKILVEIDLCDAYTTFEKDGTTPKNTVVATTGGNIDTGLKLKGNTIKMGTTFYVKGNHIDEFKK